MQINDVRISISQNDAPVAVARHVYRDLLDKIDAKDAKEREEIATFTRRVRLPFSGRVAALYSRLDAWKRERVERRAQAAFERGWV